MQAIRCPSCGAGLHVRETDRFVTCDHCGTVSDLREPTKGGAKGRVVSNIKIARSGSYERKGPHYSVKGEYNVFSGEWNAELRDVQGDAEIRGPGVYMRVGRGSADYQPGAQQRELDGASWPTDSDEFPEEISDEEEAESDSVLAYILTRVRRSKAIPIVFAILIGTVLLLLGLALFNLLSVFTP